MIKRYFFIVGLISIFFSCKVNTKDREIVKKNKNGRIIYKAPFIIDKDQDTVIHGTITSYYSNNQLKDSFDEVYGNRNGWYYHYDSLGRLIWKSFYRNDIEDSISYLFFANGQIHAETLYKKGHINWIRNYYQTDKLQAYFIFLNDSIAKYYVLYDSTGLKTDEAGDSSKYSTTKVAIKNVPIKGYSKDIRVHGVFQATP